jgi:hypothetical protein
MVVNFRGFGCTAEVSMQVNQHLKHNLHSSNMTFYLTKICFFSNSRKTVALFYKGFMDLDALSLKVSWLYLFFARNMDREIATLGKIPHEVEFTNVLGIPIGARQQQQQQQHQNIFSTEFLNSFGRRPKKVP